MCVYKTTKLKIIMKLLIDTTQTKKAIVKLENGKKVQKVGDSPLPLIEKILSQEKIKLCDLTEIKAHPGPGSFTGVRVGIAVANALNFALGRKKIQVPKY